MSNNSMCRCVVIIPAFNAASTIGETLDALQRNEGLNEIAKVVLLDDCSRDQTVEIATQCWKSTVPLEVWRNDRNLGERSTTNSAICRLAPDYDWTFILHADDVVKPHWLDLYFKELRSLPAAVATICSSYDVWWPDTGRLESGEDDHNRSSEHIAGNFASVAGTLKKGCWWHISGSAIHNASFMDIGGFDVDMPQLGDFDWLLRVLARGYGVLYLPRTTMLYRQHGATVSSKSFREARDLRERIAILKRVADQGLIDEAAHKKYLRLIVVQLLRRCFMRAVRFDVPGLRAHVGLLANEFIKSV